MFFLSFSNINIKFVEQSRKLIQKSYTAIQALPTTYKIEFINKREFINTILDENLETFIIYVSTLKVTIGAIYLSWIAQIAIL